MSDDFIPQFAPWFTDAEADAVHAYMKSGGWLTEFKQTEQFEQMIASYTGARHCIVTNNGTVSLTLAALASGIGPGDEVIVPNYTQIATPNSVLMFGANPVFVDVEPETLCLDVARAEKAITKKTKAVFLVSANGRAPRVGIAAVEALCRKHGLTLLEDSAQSLGAFYPDGRHVGTVGAVGSFSFSVPKIITTGQGGALVTNDDAIAKHLRKLKDFGRTGGGNDIHDTIGYNFKFTDMQAAVGIEQMKKLAERVALKKELLRTYRNELEGAHGISLFGQDLNCAPPWFIDVLADRRDALQVFLKEKGIGTRVMYPPINSQKAYQRPGSFPVSERVGREGLWLPSSSQLTTASVQRVCAAIRAFYAS
jgi:perosamine synthetase